MRVEIWDGEGGKKQGNKWVLGKEVSLFYDAICADHEFLMMSCIPQASPGNIQQLEDLLFSNSDNTSSPLVMALKLVLKDGGTTRSLGVAFADASARKLGVSEFLDDEMFSNTEVRITQASKIMRPDRIFLLCDTESNHPTRCQRMPSPGNTEHKSLTRKV